MRRLIVLCALLLPVTANAQRPGADRALNVAVEDVYRVGGEQAPEWATLVDVRAVSFGPAGELWVADLRGRNVLKIAADGRSGRAMARQGRGPGEIQAPRSVTALADGRVLVDDLLNSSLQLLSAEGKLIASTTGRADINRLDGVAWLGGDEFIGAPRVYIVDGEAHIGDEVATAIPLYRFTVASTPRVTRVLNGRYSAPPKHAEPLTPHAFAPRFHWTAHNGRIAYVDGIEYDIHIVDGSGRETARIRRDLTARAPSAADRDAARADARARLIGADGRPRIGGVSTSGSGGAPDPNEMRRRVERALDGMSFGERVPLIQGVRFDHSGNLWVARTADVWGRPPLLDVFAPNGDYLGTTRALPRLPDAFGPDGRVAFMEKDALDVPYVVVRRVTLR